MGGWPPIEKRHNSPRPGVISGMEQRQFFEARGEESGEWLVLDAKRHPPRVICRCLGWSAPKNAALIVAALGGAQFGALFKIRHRGFGAAK